MRDTSGAILPGVTVEAASSALIEKSRTAFTDGTGQYRITELPPGAYSVTFTLAGFSTVKREGLEVTGSGVITITIEMRVGAVSETITVSGRTPVVDIQSTRRQVVLDNETINVLPAARGYGPLLAAVPSLQGGNLSSSTTAAMTFFTTHGGRPNEGRVQVDGLNVGAAFNGGGVSGFAYDVSNSQEMQVTLSGGLGEAEVGGPNVNIIPRTGGNTFRGTFFGSAAGRWSQGSNLDDQLRSFGITEQAALVKSWDTSGAYGGPIKKDRLWFFANVRDYGSHTDLAGLYGNQNAGDPAKWTYLEDRSLKARSATAKTTIAVRLTAQVTPRNKVGVSIDHQLVCDGSAYLQDADSCRPRGANWVAAGSTAFGRSSPEASTSYQNTRERITQITWSSPVTNRLLLEAGYSSFISRWGAMESPGALTKLTPVTEQANIYGVANFSYRGLDNFYDNSQNPNTWRASASYVTGAHNMKFGYQGAYHIEETMDFANDTQLTYTVNNGNPTSFGFRIAPWQTSNRTTYHSVYAQDQWTVGRATLQGAVRYDRAWSWFPAEHNGAPFPSRFNRAPIAFPRSDGVKGYNDITPRMGVAYDVFGHGKTALKVNVGKYLESANNQATYVINNPALDGRNGRGGPRFVTNTTRSWTDTNGNKIPDCDLINPLRQDNSATGGDICAQWNNLNFANAQNLLQVNPAVLEGWGIRPWDWQVGASVQQEILPRLSVEVGYHRRWFGNTFVTDNLTVGPDDYDRYTVTAPQHPQLPGGGGYQFTALNIKPEKFGQAARNYYTFSSDYGNDTRYWHGLDVTFSARPRNGLIFQGGTSTGHGVRDNCEVTAKVPELLFVVNTFNRLESCHVDEKWLTSFRGLATYTVPKIDVLVSGIVRVQPNATLPFGGSASNGTGLSATYTVPNTVVQQTLGRLPSGGLANGNTSVALLLPNELYAASIKSADMRFAKVLRFGHSRTDIGIDLYNIFNANTPTTYNTQFGFDGATWLRPTAILNPRFLRFNATVNF